MGQAYVLMSHEKNAHTNWAMTDFMPGAAARHAELASWITSTKRT